jgi:GcrA cell cycle regulator
MSNPQQSVWTDDRLEQLKQLWGEGLSITQIGQRMGMSRNAVVGKVHRMGLPKRQSPIQRSDKPLEPRRRKLSPLVNTKWDRGTCSWPIGDPKAADFAFCGGEIEPGKPYCKKHCAMAYTRAKEDAA